ncbi:MAG: type II secretion system secretin GspD [Gallionella sp.]|nr:type II secretion system secretin GspD [Gallionella sp.]
MKINRNEMFSTLPFCALKSVAAIMLLCTTVLVSPAQAVTENSGDSTLPKTDQGSLNFVGADIESVIAAIGDYTGITFIIDPRVKGTVNLVSEKPVSKAQAFHLLTSVLRLHGYTVVNSNGYSKVVPEAEAKSQAGPIRAGAIRGDQIATQVFRLNYESATNLVAVLRPLVSPNNTINANPGNNTLVITDYTDNLLRLKRIIAALDAPSGNELDVIPIRHAIAGDIAAMVNRLMDSGPPVTGSESVNVSLLADARSNSVILRAPSEERANLARALIEKLDQPTLMPGNVHVVYLKNAEATKLAQILRTVLSANTASATPAAASSPASPEAVQQSTSNGSIQADPATNTLIITASEAVYHNLRGVIDQLDARRAQVYIESLIVEVSATRAAEFGVQWGALSGSAASKYRLGGVTGFGTGGDNLINQAAASANGGALPPGNGLSLGLFRQVAGKIGLAALAHALASDDDANILSMPNLITLDNEEAKIIVGQNVPFITGQYTTTASGGGAGVNPFQTIERKDIGLSLRVRPQISEGGTVRLAIYQETSSVQDASGAAGIITNKRSIDTNVLVDDGQIIVLGGLIDDSLRDGVVKVPGLGDIPVVGNLFKYQKRSRVKTNLMVFLRPTVIRNSEQSVSLSGDRYEFIRNAEIAAHPGRSLLLPDLGAPQLPPLQNGLPLGGAPFGQQGAVPADVPPESPAAPALPATAAPASVTEVPLQP